MTPALHKIWCDEDEYYRYEHFADFHEWLVGFNQPINVEIVRTQPGCGG